jgi:hypothetical protein
VITKSTRSAPSGEAPDQLVVGGGNHRDRGDHQRHREEEVTQVTVEVAQGGLDCVGDRGDGIGHHREGEGDEEHSPPAQAPAALHRGPPSVDDGTADQTSRHTLRSGYTWQKKEPR